MPGPQSRHAEKLQNENGALKVRLKQVMAEKEKLQSAQPAMEHAPLQGSLDAQQLHKENARLRRQLKTAWSQVRALRGCGRC